MYMYCVFVRVLNEQEEGRESWIEIMVYNSSARKTGTCTSERISVSFSLLFSVLLGHPLSLPFLPPSLPPASLSLFLFSISIYLSVCLFHSA